MAPPAATKRARDGRDPRVDVRPKLVTIQLQPDAVDRLALDFCQRLARARVRYVIVSGYVAILLGRNRLSEDIDIFTEELTLSRFRSLHRSLTSAFECITPGPTDLLFSDYLASGDDSTSIRYARPGAFSPNVELKFAHKPHHFYSLLRRVPAVVNGQRVYIGALEMDIAYKVKMGTEKDLADAQWIYDRSRKVLDLVELRKLMEGLDAHAEWIR